MKKWLRGIRGAVRMGLIWAAQWALAGLFIEAFVDPNGSLVDMWPQTLAIPGFLVGVLFSAVLQIVGYATRERLPAGAGPEG